MIKNSQKAKVLLSCYACEPNQGSEPGVGWNWTKAMSDDNDLVVVTRSNNQAAIESGTSELVGKKVEFVYYDLPKWLLYLKKKGILKTSLYYAFWQLGIRRRMAKRMDEFDIVHHMTFNMFLCPGYWRPQKAKLILGPLGGGSCVPESYLSLFGKKSGVQEIREKIVNQWKWVPTLKKTFKLADVILCANEDTYELLNPHYPGKCKLHLETGFDLAKINNKLSESKSLDTFIQVGSIEPRKGWRLTLMAASKLINERKFTDFKIEFVGSGPEYAEAVKVVSQMNLTKVVQFHGKKTLAETQKLLAGSRALLFPSVRDTSGNVVLEAMSQSVPVICINHQGAKEMTDDLCAIRLEPSNIDQTVEDLANAIQLLHKNSELVERMGVAGTERIKSYHAWSSKKVYMQEIYDSVLKRHHSNVELPSSKECRV